MKLVSDALDVSYRNRKNVLRTLLQKVKNPANRVSRQEIRTAVTAMLSSEKQRQLLGTSDAPDPDLAELLNEVARLERQGGKVSIKMGELRLKYGPAE